MKQVSVEGEELFTRLVSWELLGDTETDPKATLRSASDEDLQIVMHNIESDRHLVEFMAVKMVRLELMYREQLLDGDWEVRREGSSVTVTYAYVPKKPLQRIFAVISVGELR